MPFVIVHPPSGGGGGGPQPYQCAYIGERAVSGICYLLGNTTQYLTSAIEYVCSGHADGIPMETVEAVYDYKLAVNPIYSTFLEVFQTPNTEVDIYTQTYGSTEVRSEVEVQVRLTWINRTQNNPSNCIKIMQRYQAAIVKVFQDNPLLSDSNYNLDFSQKFRFELSDDKIETDGMTHVINRTTATLTVRVYEFNSVQV